MCPIIFDLILTFIGGNFMEVFNFKKNIGMIMVMISKPIINAFGRIVKGLGSGH